jgi:hypothetical protein
VAEEKKKTLEERARELDRGLIDRIGDAMTFATRGKGLHRLDDSKVRCPLCHVHMEERWDQHRKMRVLVCHNDRVAIAKSDPFVGKWEEGLKGDKVPCPACDGPMRFFCTSTGYVKARCTAKGCGAEIASAQPDRPLGATVIPPASKGEGQIDRPVDGTA